MDFKHSDAAPVKSKDIKAEIYRFGWIRLPDTMMMKIVDFHKLNGTDDAVEEFKGNIVSYYDMGNL